MFNLRNNKISQHLELYFSTVRDGNMSFKFDHELVVRGRRLNFLANLNIEFDKCVIPQLQHGDEIIVIEKKDLGRGIMDWKNNSPEVDAMITCEKNAYLFMLTADCLPIVLFDPDKNVLALIHAGWRGTELKVVQKTIQKMVAKFGSEERSIIAIIGPCIRSSSYRFENVVQKSEERIDLWSRYLTDNTDGTTSIDLVG